MQGIQIGVHAHLLLVPYGLSGRPRGPWVGLTQHRQWDYLFLSSLNGIYLRRSGIPCQQKCRYRADWKFRLRVRVCSFRNRPRAGAKHAKPIDVARHPALDHRATVHRAAGSRSQISQGTWWLRTKISGGPDGSTHNRPISTAGEKRQFLNPDACYGTKSSRLEKKLAHSSIDNTRHPSGVTLSREVENA